MDDNRQIFSTWFSFATLSGWLLVFMRLCFWSAEAAGLAYRDNTIFILYCAGVILGMMIPLPDLKTHWRRNQALIVVSSVAAVPCAVIALIAHDSAGPVFVLLASFFISAALGCVLYSISARLKPGGFGMFFGTAFAASEVFFLAFLLTLYDNGKVFPTPAIITGLCFIPVLAAAVFVTGRAPSLGDEAVLAASPALPVTHTKAVLLKYLCVMLLYCVMGGVLDNLTAFENEPFAIPHLLDYAYIYSAAANLTVGILLRRVEWPKLAMTGVLLICAGQAIPYFYSGEALAVSYLALTTFGIVTMEFLARALPARYAANMSKQAGYARLGYASLYGGFLITSVLFESLPQELYFFLTGIVLALSLTILALLYSASNDEEKEQRAQLRRMLRDLSEAAAQSAPDTSSMMDELLTPDEKKVALLLIDGETQRDIARKLHLEAADTKRRIAGIREKIGGIGDPDKAVTAAAKEYNLTGREVTMLRLLRDGMTNPQIAAELFISESTVKNHIHSLMKKLPVDDRHEIPSLLEKSR